MINKTRNHEKAPIRPWYLVAISTTGGEQIIAENPLPVSRVKTINLGVHDREEGEKGGAAAPHIGGRAPTKRRGAPASSIGGLAT